MTKQVPLPIFTFEDTDDTEEHLVVKMNGVVVADVNHDDVGWAGISAVRRVVDAIEMQLTKVAK
jgi:hypothetical protein